MSSAYAPPLQEIEFVLDTVARLDELASLPAFAHVDPDTVKGALQEAGRWVSEIVAPLNHSGDRQHSVRHPDGTVTTPDGFRGAYQQWVTAGWGSVPFPTEYGGGGFPWTVGVAVHEMLASANMALSLCPLLTQGAIDLLLAHGSDAQRARYLPAMINGEWTGTMNLTEPHAGSDVGALTTKATQDADGRWRVSGQKIFITYGEHDLAPNIVHLVLARVPDAPPGSRGISCFAVPKRLINPDGSLGQANQVTCLSIEEKLGIHASPTCVLAFEDAYAELIGEPNRGMQYMFTMMNNARLSVGLQGVAVGQAAYQQAVDYARERIQARTLDPRSTAIIGHPDVRRMLLTQKATLEAARALVYLVAGALDQADSHPDQSVRDEQHELVELLTPVAKAWSTDIGVTTTSLALQVHGGMGYIEETGIAQYYRDSRIAPIYEGTNGIQAIDLVTRKLPRRDGMVVKELIARMAEAERDLAQAEHGLKQLTPALSDALDALTQATEHLQQAQLEDKLAGASPYLEMMGLVVGGWLMAHEAMAAQHQLGQTTCHDEAFLEAKLVTTRFYLRQLLPKARALLPAVIAGAGDLMEMPPEQF
jgi:alkylation response protein AidB-like acyl-CoA dehydrogenase